MHETPITAGDEEQHAARRANDHCAPQGRANLRQLGWVSGNVLLVETHGPPADLHLSQLVCESHEEVVAPSLQYNFSSALASGLLAAVILCVVSSLEWLPLPELDPCLPFSQSFY